MRKRIYLLVAALLLIAGVVLLWNGRRSQRLGPVSPGAGVAGVSVAITHGTNHVFYYRGRIAWGLEQICQRAGLRLRTGSERLVSTTRKPSDMLWLICKNGAQPPTVGDVFTGYEVRDGRLIKAYDFTGCFLDKKRGVSVYWWPMPGGLLDHQGSTLHLKNETNGKELLAVQIPRLP